MDENLKPIGLLLLVLVFLIGIQLAAASPSLAVNVYTDKLRYNVDENIRVYGSVLSGGMSLPDVSVALEIHDPAGSTVITRSPQTNSSGVYSVTFKLPQGAPTGNYDVYVSCAHGGETAFNSTSFQTSALVITIAVEKQSYSIGENVTIFGTATLNNLKLPGALIAIEVQNPNATPIIIRVLQTDSQGAYGLTFQAPTGSVFGTYKAFATASHEGSVAAAETSFTLRRETPSADINGDGVVNILDLALVAKAWGSSPGDARWDPRCDLDGSGKVNILDLTMVARAWTG